ncbi:MULTISPECIES: DUF4440 domain-containing protein [Rahnella]|uniref:DUF4440 domain-containing protein n=1 Tax=Rahnella laticis TaxID=2787622 RepID=A0ABS0E007_9GAMM|nr:MULTISPECIES: DUF4440 domain-containing protein [Rahnella]MBF7978443.1 DUF4440 domain-containing protein [Rahnella laticis]MBF7998533.1 DUF4440 domain-containing protein [Rahnella sp. LAC-M12]
MNRFVKEVFDAHELIRQWLGDTNSPQAICDELLARFSADYSMVTLTGHRLDYAALRAFFKAQHGAKTGLEIQVEQPELIAESEMSAVVTYQERQQLPGQTATLRYSTVVFSVDAQGKILWRHLHETAAG